MCGLCGVVDLGRAPETETVRRMAAALDHRGPDGDGSFADDGVALGFRRLAIIDLSDAGRQPFASVPFTPGHWSVPLFAMPSWMAQAGNVSPVKWAVIALEGAVWRGFSLAEMALPLGIPLTLQVTLSSVAPVTVAVN